MKLSENAKEWIKDLGIAVVCAVVLLQFIQPTIVREHSMENTLVENDYLFVSKQAYKLFGNDPATGDIIVFKSELTTATGQNKLLIKRVIAVGGDTIAIHGGVVYLNGEALDEEYTKDGYTNTEMDEITVPEGYVFAMGDNRQNSADSRDSRIGCVEEGLILGKAVVRLFPFNKFGGLY
ncbi:MAG: signal peptidase I [Clostridia bacterium]|nr:signal peptidase I [Clostridia bacterium]